MHSANDRRGLLLRREVQRREQLAFRDALRADAAVRADYAALKRRLASEHSRDIAAYTDAKAPFIRSVLDRHLA
jgi:GrpB-like predicted nucleotidyltransferase (UPF0157 family)